MCLQKVSGFSPVDIHFAKLFILVTDEEILLEKLDHQ